MISAYGSAIATSVIDPHTMPHKHNAARRHRICKMKFKVTNWREYEAGLRRRGSLTLWLTPEALAGWAAPRRTTRGGQPRYSDLAIEHLDAWHGVWVTAPPGRLGA